tara:strand:- start:73 stop:639 length:567 start_codon:yes stop_codon:yes gene_type:complete
MDPATLKLETQRLILRPLAVDEAPLLAKLTNDSIHTLQPWLAFAQEPQHVEDTRKFLTSAWEDMKNDKHMEAGVFLKDGTLIGMCGYKTNTPFIEGYEIGYWLSYTHIGQGYMSEAVKVVADFCFTQKSAQRVWAWVLKENEPSRKVLERCNFIYEARLRNAGKTPAGAVCDKLIYAHTPKSWKKHTT